MDLRDFFTGLWNKTCDSIKGTIQNIKKGFIRFFNYVTGTKKKKYCFITISLVIVVVIVVNVTVFLWPTSDNTGISITPDPRTALPQLVLSS